MTSFGVFSVYRWSLRFVAGLTALLLVLVGCDESSPIHVADEDRQAFLDSTRFAATRPFLMGFTPWPYEFSNRAQEETYDAMDRHGDLALFHLDTGVPWPEALAGDPFHQHVQEYIGRMRGQAANYDKIYVSVTAQSQDRSSLAGYWGDNEHLDRPGDWANKSFEDPEVRAAYIAYCKRIVAYFNPDYFAYGIEVNGGIREGSPVYPAFKEFLSVVYAALKAEYPNLPIFLTFQTGTFEATWAEQQEVNRDLVQYSDYVGMSTYPFWVPGLLEPDDADMSYLPADWFEQMRNIAPTKPFVIAETGYIAEDFALGSVQIGGRELWQAEYVDRLLWASHALDAEFVVWFVVRDYDRGYAQLVDMGVNTDAFRIWRDTGLLDGDGEARLGMEVWDRWLALERREK